ncbi:pyridine nucleotide-disulfide oxidoreductase family protein [Solidesulfovibrio fructosivorans JJ]]|uniref:Pyridine nucleotide-disulfide oxidoreductase family protein n=1 Tax=Solidesulfovibrio fructosivorans JJ] TaxID=596151 RepID=E1JSP9_SOLFR|nr:FAD-dependent oxidoreductase [Solidesulfovibrio fructosivorans]EFL52532.1 pyridine nucleotide-disulfide oxidoreductase family protein [Solidesulfovibrio fructosivorans JJ]]
MRKRLVLAGGGHAHLFTLSRLGVFDDAGIDVVCVAPGPFLAYSGMGPGMLSGRYALEDLRFDIEAMLSAGARHTRGASRFPPARANGAFGHVFVQGRVTGIDPEGKGLVLEDGRELAYDVASFGLGSVVDAPFPVAGEGVRTVKPIENLLAARCAIESRVEAGEAVRVVVAGGGASAFEVAGNALGLLAGLGVTKPLVTVVAGRGLLPGWPARARRLAHASLTYRGAKVLCDRVERFDGGRVMLVGGGSLSCDMLLVATGTRPPGVFARSGLTLSPDGGLSVNAFLQSPLYPDIFGGGDCVHFAPKPLPRAGVYAVRQGPVLCANLLARLTGRNLTPFRRTGTDYLALLNCGDGRAILRQGPLVLEGRWCMALKDWIDRRFIRSFGPPRPPRKSGRPA